MGFLLLPGEITPACERMLRNVRLRPVAQAINLPHYLPRPLHRRSDHQDFAGRLHADLQSKGVRFWFAPHDVQGGGTLHEQIDEAIRLYDKLLLILSTPCESAVFLFQQFIELATQFAKKNCNSEQPTSAIP